MPWRTQPSAPLQQSACASGLDSLPLLCPLQGDSSTFHTTQTLKLHPRAPPGSLHRQHFPQMMDNPPGVIRPRAAFSATIQTCEHTVNSLEMARGIRRRVVVPFARQGRSNSQSCSDTCGAVEDLFPADPGLGVHGEDIVIRRLRRDGMRSRQDVTAAIAGHAVD